MCGCQNYDPFLGTLNIRCRIIVGIQKKAIILTTTHLLVASRSASSGTTDCCGPRVTIQWADSLRRFGQAGTRTQPWGFSCTRTSWHFFGCAIGLGFQGLRFGVSGLEFRLRDHGRTAYLDARGRDHRGIKWLDEVDIYIYMSSNQRILPQYVENQMEENMEN